VLAGTVGNLFWLPGGACVNVAGLTAV